MLSSDFWKNNKKKLVSLVMLTIVYLVTLNIYWLFKGSFEAQLATGQLEDSIVTYSLINKAMYGSGIEWLITFCFGIVILPTLAVVIYNSREKSL